MHNDIMKCIIKNATVALFKLGTLGGKCLLKLKKQQMLVLAYN